MSPKLTEMNISLAGFNHRMVAEDRRKLAEETPLAVELVREPKNPHDHDAIMVVIKEKPWKDRHIGYVPRAIAGILAPKMDSGRVVFQEAWVTELDPEDGTGELFLKVVKSKKRKT